MTQTHTFEVSVPLVVKVEVLNDGATARVVGATIESGFPGFHSEAEEAAGVWDPANDEWSMDDVDSIVRVAWSHVRRLVIP
jgi:hypothetical protein